MYFIMTLLVLVVLVRGEAKALFSILTLYYLIQKISAPLAKNTQSKAGSPSGGWSIAMANFMS